MESSLWIAKTGVDAQRKRMAVISNNLANVNTTGFKRGRAVFEDLLYQNIRQVGGQTSLTTQLPSGLSLGAGVRTVATQKMHTQGNMINTENNLDIAIQGRGFFQILMPDGTTSYTRDGSFQTDSQGQIVTSNGYPMLPSLTVPANTLSISISSDGTVEALVSGSATPSNIGTLQLADFINPAGLEAVGENLFRESVSSGTPITAAPSTTGMGSVTQGFLESSNVNVVEELVNMIEAQRAYEMNSKAISTTNDMLQYASQQL